MSQAHALLTAACSYAAPGHMQGLSFAMSESQHLKHALACRRLTIVRS